MLMVDVVFIDGTQHAQKISVPPGLTLMEAATRNGIAGIEAICGGACSCATCHVYGDEAWLDRLTPPNDIEAFMLEEVSQPAPNSRLSCQINLSEDLYGIQVTVAQEQGR